MTWRLLIFLTVAFLFTATLLPVLSMVFHTFFSHGNFDFSAYKVLFQDSSLTSFQNSLLLSLLVAAASTFAGTVLGIVLGKTKLPGSYVLVMLLTLPLLIPPYILALGWYEVLGREGFWGELLFGFWGTSWVLFCTYLPIPMLLSMLFLTQINPRFEEAARLMTGWPQVLRYITLPLLFPAVILSFLLVFILTFGEQSVANFLRFDVFSLESFTYFSAFYDFKTATVLAVPMVIVALLVLAAEQFGRHKHLWRFDTAYSIEKINLGNTRIPLLIMILLLISLTVLLPLAHLFAEAADIHLWAEALTKAYQPILRSYLYATLGATALMFFGFFSGYLLTERMFAHRFYDAALIFMFALPATVTGIALILFWNTPYTNFIYGTPLIILFAYLGKYLALTAKITQNRLGQIPHSQVEAAQLAGANPFQVLRFILAPLSKKALLITWVIGFIFSLRETTMTMLLYPPGYDTLPIYILTQMANGEPGMIAALSVIMILMSLLPLLVLGYFTKDPHD